MQPLDEQCAKLRTAAGNYIFDREEVTLEHFNLRDSLGVPGLSELEEVKFTKTSQGCFHFDQAEKVYRRKGDRFIAKQGKGAMESENLGRILAEILADPPVARLKELPLHPKVKSYYVRELEKAIKAKKKAGKHDRPRFAALLHPEKLRDYPMLPDSQLLRYAFYLAYRGERGWSTTTNTETIEFRFQSGLPLVLTHQHSFAFPAYLQWRVDYGKDSFYCFSGVLRDFHLKRQLKAEERLAADTELLLQLAEIWGRAEEGE